MWARLAQQSSFTAAANLRAEGVPVTCRIQPVLPGREDDAFDVIERCAESGIQHVAVEHLKLPVEQSWQGRSALDRALRLDTYGQYQARGAFREGRERYSQLPTALRELCNFGSMRTI